jgi:hypothetical protein
MVRALAHRGLKRIRTVEDAVTSIAESARPRGNKRAVDKGLHVIGRCAGQLEELVELGKLAVGID